MRVTIVRWTDWLGRRFVFIFTGSLVLNCFFLLLLFCKQLCFEESTETHNSVRWEHTGRFTYLPCLTHSSQLTCTKVCQSCLCLRNCRGVTARGWGAWGAWRVWLGWVGFLLWGFPFKESILHHCHNRNQELLLAYRSGVESQNFLTNGATIRFKRWWPTSWGGSNIIGWVKPVF